MERLAGRVALVSGAGRGIGAAVAQRLADEGATVVASDLDAPPGGIALDVTEPDSVRAGVANVVERHGRIDVVANVAGIGISRLIDDVELEEWTRTLAVNLTGTFLLSQAALPALRLTRGCIVNMASVAGLRATPFNAAYCASKGGVILLTKSMAIELAADGVRVNAVCPSGVDTAFLRNFQLPDGADLALLRRASPPMGGLVEADQVAGAVAYLASDDAAKITGTTLVIDGGATA